MINRENIKQALKDAYDYFKNIIQNFDPKSIESWGEIIKIAAIVRMLYMYLPTILRFLAQSSIQTPQSLIATVYSLIKNTAAFLYYPLYALSKTFVFIFPSPFYPIIALVLLLSYTTLKELYQNAYQKAARRYPNRPLLAQEAMKESLPIVCWYLYLCAIPALLVLTLFYTYPMLLLIAQNIYALPSSIHWLLLSSGLMSSSLLFVPYSEKTNMLTFVFFTLYSLATYHYGLISPVVALCLLLTPISRTAYYRLSNLSNHHQEKYQTLLAILLTISTLALIIYPLYITPGPSIFSAILLKITFPILFCAATALYENRFIRYTLAILSILSFNLPTTIAIQLIQASLLSLCCYDMYSISHYLDKGKQTEVALPSAIAFLLLLTNILMYYNLAHATLPAIAIFMNSFILVSIAISLITPPSFIGFEKRPVFYGTMANIVLDTLAFVFLNAFSLQVTSQIVYRASATISFITICYAQLLLSQQPSIYENTPR